MKLRNIIGKIHLWLGLVSGLVVFIVSITGCIYVFKEEISSVVYRDRRQIEMPKENLGRMPFSKLYNKASDELPNDPLFVEIFGGPNGAFAFWTWTTDPSSWTYMGKTPIYEVVYINPYTGESLYHENKKTEFFSVVLGIHWSLLLNDEIGGNIVGISTLTFILMLITGLALWWPGNRKAVKMRTWFRWNKSTRWRRKNYDIHNITGFYVMILSLLIALTGLVWVYEWVDNGIKWVANGGKHVRQKEKVSELIASIALPEGREGDASVDIILQNYPSASVYWVTLEEANPKPTYLTARNHRHHNLQNVSFAVNSSGKMTPAPMFSEKNNGEKLDQMNYDIHVGSILGLPGKILAFFASLISASLPVTGFLIWYGRRKKKRSYRPGKKPKVLPQVTS